MKKKVITIFLAAALCVSMLPVNALAGNAAETVEAAQYSLSCSVDGGIDSYIIDEGDEICLELSVYAGHTVVVTPIFTITYFDTGKQEYVTGDMGIYEAFPYLGYDENTEISINKMDKDEAIDSLELDADGALTITVGEGTDAAISLSIGDWEVLWIYVNVTVFTPHYGMSCPDYTVTSGEVFTIEPSVVYYSEVDTEGVPIDIDGWTFSCTKLYDSVSKYATVGGSYPEISVTMSDDFTDYPAEVEINIYTRDNNGSFVGYIYFTVTVNCDHIFTGEMEDVSFDWAGDYGSCTVSYVCPKCGEELSLEADVASEITAACGCTEDGVVTYTATVEINGAKYSETATETLPATGHSFTAEVTTAATYEAPGVLTYTCSRCGDTYTEKIPQLSPGFEVESEIKADAAFEETVDDGYYYELDVQPMDEDGVDAVEVDMITELAEALAPENVTLEYYFMDLTFLKYTTSVDYETLASSPSLIRVTLTIPEAYAGGDDYLVIRIHDDVAAVLDSAYDAARGTVTFSTDKFSTYALVKLDAENDDDDENGDSNDGDSGNGNTGNDNSGNGDTRNEDVENDNTGDDDTGNEDVENDNTEDEDGGNDAASATADSVGADTGDANHPGAYLLLVVACAVAVAASISRQRRV